MSLGGLERMFSRLPCHQQAFAAALSRCRSLQTAPFSAQAARFAQTSKPVDCPRFEQSLDQEWIYPLNERLRDYQRDIVKRALCENTLVAMPTGLGKTLVAAEVMYNFYRRYPQGKVVFVAPTRPQEAEQRVTACFHSTSFPTVDTALLTGDVKPEERANLWLEKRVFFLRPKILLDDLKSGRVPVQSVSCVVLDKSHKALRKNAYRKVVLRLLQFNEHFRILALSTTLGNGGDLDSEAMQQALSSLNITHVESRTEDSPDVALYLPDQTK